MKRFLVASLLFVSTCLAQGPAKTTISDTLYDSSGNTRSGYLMITNRTNFTSSDDYPIPAGSVKANISAGVVSLPLVPNIGATPSGTSYEVEYHVSGLVTKEYWVIPSGGPVKIADVRVITPPVTTYGTLPVGQVTPPSPCIAGYFLEWSGTGWQCSVISPTIPPGTANEVFATNTSGLGTEWRVFDAPGGTGTAPNWAFSFGHISLNLPMAASAGTTAGLLSKTQYDALNAKQGTPVVLTTDVSGILPSANGGTGVAYFGAAGPTAPRTYTFPDSPQTMEYQANKNTPYGYAGLGSDGLLAAAVGQEVWSITDLLEYSGTSGSGATAIRATVSAPSTNDVLTWSGTNWINQPATLASLTQITNRSHTLLSDIGTNSHAAIDNHISAATPTPQFARVGAGQAADATAPFAGTIDSATTNTILDILKLTRSTTGTAGDGIGGALVIYVEDGNGNLDEALRFQASFPIAAHATQTGRVDITAMGAAAGVSVQSDGQVAVRPSGAALARLHVEPAAGLGGTIISENGATLAGILGPSPALLTLVSKSGSVYNSLFYIDEGVGNILNYQYGNNLVFEFRDINSSVLGSTMLLPYGGVAFESGGADWGIYRRTGTLTGIGEILPWSGFSPIGTNNPLPAISISSTGTVRIASPSTLGSESLNETAFTTHAKWDTTGDFNDTAGNAKYTHNTGVGTLTQTAVNMLVAGAANRFYHKAYTVSGLSGDVACTITTTFAAEATPLNLTSGAQTTDFLSAAAPGSFVVSCTSTLPGGVTLDDVSLKPVAGGDLIVDGSITTAKYKTLTNCADGTATPADCAAAPAGAVIISATATSVVVNTTAVTATSRIMVTRDNSLGTELSVTCNTQSDLVLGTARVTAKTAATSFTIAVDVAPTTDPLCLAYLIFN